MNDQTRYDIVLQLHLQTLKESEYWRVVNGEILRSFPLSPMCNSQLTDEEFLEWFEQQLGFVKIWVGQAEKLLKQAKKEE